MPNPKGSPQNLKRTAGPGRPKGSKNHLSRERIEQELKYLALSDPVKLFDRAAKGSRTFTLKQIHDMPEEMRRCIASVKVRTENLTAGDGEQDTTVEVKLWEKTKALELCARTLGMLTDKVEIVNADELAARLERGRQRNAGRE